MTSAPSRPATVQDSFHEDFGHGGTIAGGPWGEQMARAGPIRTTHRRATGGLTPADTIAIEKPRRSARWTRHRQFRIDTRPKRRPLGGSSNHRPDRAHRVGTRGGQQCVTRSVTRADTRGSSDSRHGRAGSSRTGLYQRLCWVTALDPKQTFAWCRIQEIRTTQGLRLTIPISGYPAGLTAGGDHSPCFTASLGT
jgi:hypothetical protein